MAEEAFEPVFVEELPHDFMCPICLSFAREPHLIPCCGHHFCRQCAERLQKERRPCPVCKSPAINPVYDKFFERKMNQLKIRCPNSRARCNWVGELGDLKRHTEKCLVECDFSSVGCTAKLPRSRLAQHMQESMGTHLMLTVTKNNEEIGALKAEACVFMGEAQTLKDELLRAHERIRKLELTASTVTYQPQAITSPEFVMTNFQKHKKKGDEWWSPSFYTHPGGYKMCVRVLAHGLGARAGTHVSLFVHLMAGRNDDNLEWPFRGEVTAVLVNQRKESSHLSTTLHFQDGVVSSRRVVGQERSSMGKGINNIVDHSDLGYNRERDTEYLKNDCLKFRITQVKLT